MNQKQTAFFIVLLLCIGFFLRVVWLDSVPPGLNSDELLMAYDGASVYHTGKDHHGDWFPLFFKQSGEYRQPIYVYLAGIFSYFLGINAYSVRIVSVIFGTLSILMTYLFVKEIHNKPTALIAAALVTISPWNIFFSRVGWEPVLQTPVQLFALWMFFRWTKTHFLKHLLLATFSFALTFYTYPVERLFIPLMLLALVVLHFKQLAVHWKQTTMAFVLFLMMLIPSIWAYFQYYEAMQARWLFLSVFHLPDGYLQFVQHWLLHLSPMFQFITGSSFGMIGGQAYLVLLPFFYVGLIQLIRNNQPSGLILLWWFLVFSIPASMTYDRYDINSIPSSMRATCGMPILEIISAYGIYSVSAWLQSKNNNQYFAYIVGAFIFINAAYVLYDYYVRYAEYSIESSHYGFDQLVHYIEENKQDFDQVIISHKIGLHPISIASFSHRPPSPFDHSDYPKYVLPFYHYVPTYYPWGLREYERHGTISRWYYLGEGTLLLAAKANEITGAEPVHTIYYPNSEPAYELYTVNR